MIQTRFDHRQGPMSSRSTIIIRTKLTLLPFYIVKSKSEMAEVDASYDREGVTMTVCVFTTLFCYLPTYALKEWTM